jgi:purine-nucleoside phosphorylase
MQTAAEEAAHYLRSRGIDDASTGVILGTGLHKLSAEIEVLQKVPYAEIPGFCLSTVESHPGNLIYGLLGTKKVIALQGRFHMYEGYNYRQVTFPVTVMKLLGVELLFISNAAGAVNPGFRKGQLMQLHGHIDLLGLKAESASTSDVNPPMYDPAAGKILQQVAFEEGITLHSGTYAAVTGPQLETRAEYRYLRRIGADAVGMSTVPEVIEASRQQIRCVAVSVLTDECDPDNLHPVTLEEIIAVANTADELLTRLFYKTILLC